MALAEKLYYTEDDYFALPEDVRAELIDGVFFYNQASPSTLHQTIVMEISATIRNYIREKGGSCRVFPAPFAVKLKENRDTVVEPDISVICDPSKINERGCFGAPDWIIEIVSPGNPNHDYVRKLNLYEASGVREYWIVDPMREVIYVYYLVQDHFKAESYTFKDRVPVMIYDDFSIDFPDLDLTGF